MHDVSSPLAGKTVKIKKDVNKLGGQDYQVEDWWDKIIGESWLHSQGNPAALNYAMRITLSTPVLPTDDEVLYGKIEGTGHLIHLSEIEEG